jgi:hypothetical protein
MWLAVINKSGGLIYQREFGDAPGAKLDTNDTLRLASVWHSLHAISAQLSPRPGCGGIELLCAETFDLHCFQAPTGTKFFVTTPPRAQGAAQLLRLVYELYSDYVLKNPFYEAEMPIRCELFDAKLLPLFSIKRDQAHP